MKPKSKTPIPHAVTECRVDNPGQNREKSLLAQTGRTDDLLQKEIHNLLAAIDQHAPVAITDNQGKITLVNDKFCAISKYSRGELIGQDHRIINSGFHPKKFMGELRQTIKQGKVWKGAIKNRAKDGSFFWMDTTIVPFLDGRGKPLQYVAIRTDITALKTHEHEIVRLSRLHAALGQINRIIARTPARSKLFDKVCQALVKQGGFRMAWIGWPDAKTRLLEPVAIRGDDSGYLSTIRIFTDNRPESRGPAGTAFRENRPHICNDTFTDPAMLLWRDQVKQHGLHGCAAFPIHSKDDVCGVLVVYAAEPDFFQDNEIALLVEAASNLSFALENLARTEALTASELRYRRLFETSKDGILILDADTGMVVDANPFLLALLGFSHAEFLGKAIWDLGFFKDIVANEDHFAELKRKGRIHYEDLPVETRDGRRIEVEFFSSVYRVKGHQVIQCNVRDITERKEAQTTQKRTLERLQLAMKASKAGIWEHDLHTNRVEVDDQVLALYGAGGEKESSFEVWQSAIDPEDRDRVNTSIKASIDRGTDAFNTEFRIQRIDDGTPHFIRTEGSIIRDASGRPTRIIGVNWDVTEERMRETKLAEALAQEKELAEKARAGERAKSEFLAVMSHEVRTPLNSILGFAELLAQTPDLPAESSDMAQTIRSSGQSLLRIVDDVLDFSRLEAGRLTIEPSLFSPREILRDIHTALAPLARDRGLAFPLAIDESTPETLWNDAGRLRQVLLNLAGNALKFTAEGSITLGTRPARESLKTGRPGFDFFVRDTGPGIPAKDLPNIFLPFVQADSSISRRFGGTGLGLAISQNLVELMGGTLQVQSTVGTGSEFIVTLPLDSPQPQMPSSGEPPVDILDETFAGKYPLQILLVEDDVVNLKLMRMVLHKLGYEPLVAKDGDEAVEIYRRERPDCILMDLQMPRKDGIQATIEIRALEDSTPGGRRAFISALTANILVANRRQCFEVGMDGYLNKPLKRILLAMTFKRASERKSSPQIPAGSGIRPGLIRPRPPAGSESPSPPRA